MNRPIHMFVVVLVSALLLSATAVQGHGNEAATVDMATAVLDEIMVIPARRIPQSMLADAHGLAIIPNVVKGGFIVGVRYGRGVVLVRNAQGGWQPPMFITLTGGSVGWQAGVQATDVILVFKTPNSVNGLMSGKFTIGADVAAAAGPVGRQASAATDGQLRAEIYSYSRSRGLFAGVALDGSALQIDPLANGAFYQGTGLTPSGTQYRDGAQVPPAAARLMDRVARYTISAPIGANVDAATQSVPPAAFDTNVEPAAASAIRRDLAASSAQLSALLDPRWKQYLALPAEIFADGPHAHRDAVAQSLTRFETVARNPQYASLSQRPEFQSTYQLLQHYVNSLTLASSSASLTLPAPPE